MPESKIVFLYTKTFQWKDGNSKIIFKNKPEINRVYIAKQNKDSGFYDIMLPNEVGAYGLVLDSLVTDSPKWTCDFIPITYTNILDFELHLDDIKMITEELNTHPVEKEHITIGVDEDKKATALAMDKQIEYTIMDSLENLKDTDRLAYETVAGLVQYLSTKMSMQEGDTFVDNMILEGFALGKGGSMALILNELQGYMLEDDRPHNLVRAIYYILLEIIRYKINNKDE